MPKPLSPGLSAFLKVSPKIAAALAAGAPVVALESTIITHGMPWPANMEMAKAVEAAIAAEGAVPATIAVMNGKLRIGLDDGELKSLAQAKPAMKLSRADLAFAVAARKPGGTTVAATMLAASLAGIEVFATGGIGGVHKGGETSFDISADLMEFSRSPVITVCAGAKAILDIARTLEVLESQGVPVIGYGSDEFPAFWSRQSGLKSPLRLDSPVEIARLWAVRKALRQAGGMLVAAAVPLGDEIPAAQMQRHIAQALADAEQANVSGKAVTPFLLSRILELTKGRSLAANIALVLNNARIAARIAVALK